MPEELNWLTIVVIVAGFAGGYLLLSWVLKKIWPGKTEEERMSFPDEKDDDRTAGPTWR